MGSPNEIPAVNVLNVGGRKKSLGYYPFYLQSEFKDVLFLFPIHCVYCFPGQFILHFPDTYFSNFPFRYSLLALPRSVTEIYRRGRKRMKQIPLSIQ